MRFRLVIYDTNDDNKYATEHRHEFLGDRNAIFFLWHTLKVGGKKHVEVYDLAGYRQEPEKGIAGLCDYNV